MALSKYARSLFHNLKIDTPSFDYPDRPMEVFCPQMHRVGRKEYWIRGQIKKIPFTAFHGEDPSMLHDYNFMLVGMITDEYMKNLGTMHSNTIPFGMLVGRDENDYTERLGASVRNYAETRSTRPEVRDGIFQTEIEKANRCIILEKQLFEHVLDTGYVKRATKDPEISAVLLGFKIWLSRSDYIGKEPIAVSDLESSIHCLLEKHIRSKEKYRKGATIDWLMNNVYELAAKNFNYRGISAQEYRELLTKIADLPNLSIPPSDVIPEQLKPFSDFMGENLYIRPKKWQRKRHEKKKRDEYDPLKDFCYGFSDALIDRVVHNGKAMRCESCYNIITTREEPFCTLESEKRDCTTSKKGMDYFDANAEHLKEQKRGYQKKTRAREKRERKQFFAEKEKERKAEGLTKLNNS